MDALADGWNKHVASHIPDNARQFAEKHKISISVGLALFGLYLGYENVTKPPRRLRHIPQASFWGYLKAFLSKTPIDVISRKITLPVAHKTDQGLYIRFDQNGWTVHITRPEAAKKFLLKTNIFPKADLTEEKKDTIFSRFALGPNILFLNGPAWKHQRMIANPAFHQSMPIDLFGHLTVKLFKTMDSMKNPIEFHDMMERWTLDAIGKAGFDFDFRGLEDKDSQWVLLYNNVIGALRDQKYAIFPSLDTTFRFLFPDRQKKHQELTEFLDMLQEVILHKRQILKDNAKNPNIKNNERDLLTLLLEAGKEDGNALNDEELLSNLCIFFLAGHDTTANALSYAAYYLAVHPGVQQKAREEAIRVLGDTKKDVIPTLDQLQEMPYTNMIIKEVLRMNGPAITVVPREATEDTELSGVFIPKGTRVQLDIYQLHHNPRVWKDPETFNPERFAPGGEAESGGLTWLPFSSGSRQCIGMNFSLAEQRVLLPMLLRKYKWSLPVNSIHKDRVITSGFGVISPVDLYINFKKRY